MTHPSPDAVESTAHLLERGPRTLAPSPPSDPVLGHLRMMKSDPFGFLTRCMRDYGGIVRLNFVGEVVHLVSSPEHIRHVLQKQWRSYDKQTRSTEKMSLGMGTGLVTAGGETWRRQRKLSQPSFHTERIHGFSAAMTDLSNDLAHAWAEHAAAGRVVDVYREMTQLTIRVLQATLFGVTSDEESIEKVSAAVQYLEEDTFSRFVSRLDLPLSVPTPRNLRFRRTLRTLDEVLYRYIALKRGKPGDDLLTMLIEARDEDGRPFDDRELRDQLVNLLLAGYDTTAATLSWTFFLLSRHPDAQRRVRAELRAELGERDATFRDLPRLEYTRAVIQESMRLYPAVWLTKRRAVADDEVGGYFIPANSGIFVSPWVTHRNPALWSNPEGFDPTRFSTFKSIGHAIPGYLPFGDGPRICIGNSFALTEIQIVVATLIRRFELELVPGHAVVPQPLFAVAPRDGILMRIRPAPPAESIPAPAREAAAL
jgi:cytochrome P450